jgi:hypothetical protein
LAFQAPKRHIGFPQSSPPTAKIRPMKAVGLLAWTVVSWLLVVDVALLIAKML